MEQSNSLPSHALLIRAFSQKPELVAQTVKSVVDTVLLASELQIAGSLWFKNILVVIPLDGRYQQHDCGNTASALNDQLEHIEDTRVSIEIVQSGDNFCGTLNFGVRKLVAAGSDFVTILSHGARDYLTDEIAYKIGFALSKGAKVVGVALDELSESVKQGRVANTFATWDARALIEVGGFDIRASQSDSGDVNVNSVAGVEEIIPSIRLVRKYGRCIAVVEASSKHKWIAPALATDPTGYTAHNDKMISKLRRQQIRAGEIGEDLAMLEQAVMPTLPH
jgi:hypothetical protein